MATYNLRCKRGKLERKESVSVRCDDLFILTTNNKFEYLRGELLTKKPRITLQKFKSHSSAIDATS